LTFWEIRPPCRAYERAAARRSCGPLLLPAVRRELRFARATAAAAAVRFDDDDDRACGPPSGSDEATVLGLYAMQRER